MSGGRKIEALIRASRWVAARAEIRRQLAETPASHWLLSRLGLTYYEEHQYSRALRCEEAAVALSPRCPLVLWDLAGTLHMLKRHDDALHIYRWLTRRGVERIAYGPCGEGRAWARGLVADCYYRISECHRAAGRAELAERALVKHLSMRGPGCRSIYPLHEMEPELRNVRPSGNRRRGRTRR